MGISYSQCLSSGQARWATVSACLVVRPGGHILQSAHLVHSGIYFDVHLALMILVQLVVAYWFDQVLMKPFPKQLEREKADCY